MEKCLKCQSTRNKKKVITKPTFTVDDVSVNKPTSVKHIYTCLDCNNTWHKTIDTTGTIVY